MSYRRLVTWAVGLGVLIPVLWLVVQRTILSGDPNLSYLALSTYRLDRVLLALWPASILLMADPEGDSVIISAVAIAVNALMYGTIGWLIWFGLNRRRFVLPVLAVGVHVGWYFLLRWYAGA